jgi:hypothetical protein
LVTNYDLYFLVHRGDRDGDGVVAYNDFKEIFFSNYFKIYKKTTASGIFSSPKKEKIFDYYRKKNQVPMSPENNTKLRSRPASSQKVIYKASSTSNNKLAQSQSIQKNSNLPCYHRKNSPSLSKSNSNGNLNKLSNSQTLKKSSSKKILNKSKNILEKNKANNNINPSKSNLNCSYDKKQSNPSSPRQIAS